MKYKEIINEAWNSPPVEAYVNMDATRASVTVNIRYDEAIPAAIDDTDWLKLRYDLYQAGKLVPEIRNQWDGREEFSNIVSKEVQAEVQQIAEAYLAMVAAAVFAGKRKILKQVMDIHSQIPPDMLADIQAKSGFK